VVDHFQCSLLTLLWLKMSFKKKNHGFSKVRFWYHFELYPFIITHVWINFRLLKSSKTSINHLKVEKLERNVDLEACKERCDNRYS